MELAKVPQGAACAACARRLDPGATFTADDALYCGSCAPRGAAPAHIELTELAPFEPAGPGRPPVKSTIVAFVRELLGLKP